VVNIYNHVQKKGNNIVLYVTFTNSNTSFYFFASNIVDALPNYYYNKCSPHIISVATLTCKIKCSIKTDKVQEKLAPYGTAVDSSEI